MKIVVGSRNPVKIEAVKEAFSKFFDSVEVEGVEADSNVSDQPVEQETFVGAWNRANEARKHAKGQELDADYFVGVEGGMIQNLDRWFVFGAMCILDRQGRMGYGASPHFEVPDRLSQQMLEGKELGDLTDELAGEDNTKHKSGAIGFFTRNVMDRKALYVHGLVAALVPFLNEGMFFKVNDPQGPGHK